MCKYLKDKTFQKQEWTTSLFQVFRKASVSPNCERYRENEWEQKEKKISLKILR